MQQSLLLLAPLRLAVSLSVYSEIKVFFQTDMFFPESNFKRSKPTFYIFIDFCGRDVYCRVCFMAKHLLLLESCDQA